MLMDMIFGLLSLLVLYYNVTQLREFIHKYGSSIHIEVLSREVEWLMGFPMGLKTNKPLNWVLGQLIMYIIVFWNQITTFITPYETYLLRITLVFCLFGFTFELALAIDIISLCTIHVYYIYKVLLYTYR
jgi:phosphatidylinositol N-acetylglucosaminyltransferase subunit Q